MFGGRFKSRDENVLFSSSSLYPLHIKREKNIRGNMEMTQQGILPRIIITTLHCSVCVIYSRREEDNVTPAYIRKLLLRYWTDGVHPSFAGHVIISCCVVHFFGSQRVLTLTNDVLFQRTNPQNRRYTLLPRFQCAFFLSPLLLLYYNT